MEPIQFPEANKVLRRPEGMTEKECGDLHVHNDGHYSLSCWNMTLKERLSALFFGKAWLWVMSGHTQPPVALEVTKTVFKKVSHE
jgi:hypothetical protein